MLILENSRNLRFYQADMSIVYHQFFIYQGKRHDLLHKHPHSLVLRNCLYRRPFYRIVFTLQYNTNNGATWFSMRVRSTKLREHLHDYRNFRK